MFVCLIQIVKKDKKRDQSNPSKVKTSCDNNDGEEEAEKYDSEEKTKKVEAKSKVRTFQYLSCCLTHNLLVRDH